MDDIDTLWFPPVWNETMIVVCGTWTVGIVFRFHDLTDMLVRVGAAFGVLVHVTSANRGSDAVGGAKGRLVTDFTRLGFPVQRSVLSIKAT